MKFDINYKKNGSRITGVIPGGIILRQSYRSLQALTNDTLRSKIGPLVYLPLFNHKVENQTYSKKCEKTKK